MNLSEDKESNVEKKTLFKKRMVMNTEKVKILTYKVLKKVS